MSHWVGKMFSSLKKMAYDWSYSEPINSNEKLLAWRNALDIDRYFFQWLLDSPGSDGEHTLSEKAILFALNRVSEESLSGTNLVPRMPTILPELMLRLHDPNVSNARIARHISQDPSLVAEVVREANSCHYRKTDKAYTLEKAIMVLGDVGLRAVIAKASIRPVISKQSGKVAQLSAPRLWMQSERCAMGACYLAVAHHANPYEAFLAGLVKNLGMTVCLRLIDLIHKGPNLLVTPAFCQKVTAHALQISMWAAKIWRLPDAIVAALQEMYEQTSITLAHTALTQSALGNALLIGDLLSKAALLNANGQLAEHDLYAGDFSQKELDCYKKLTRDI